MASKTIYSAALSCQHGLRSCADDPNSDDWARERLVEFNVWSTASGALVKGRHSLDERLHCSAAMSIVVINLLGVLRMHISACKPHSESNHTSKPSAHQSISQPLSFEKSPRRIAQTVSDEEFGVRVRVESTLSRIVRITKRVTRSLTGSMLWLVDALPTKYDDEGIRMDLVRFREEVEQQMRLTTDHLDAVRIRLVDANVRRRRRFISASEIWVARREGLSGEFSEVTIGKPTVPKSKTEYPGPPVLPPDCQTFKCPYCCEVMPSYIADPGPWKQHVMADLCPFVCIFADCPKPQQDLMYASRADWETHLYDCHGSVDWLCQACGEEFDKADKFSHHLRERHIQESEISADKIGIITENSSRRQITQQLCCPLCPALPERRDSLDHIAYCLQELAMEAFHHISFSPTASLAKTLEASAIIVPQLEIPAISISTTAPSESIRIRHDKTHTLPRLLREDSADPPLQCTTIKQEPFQASTLPRSPRSPRSLASQNGSLVKSDDEIHQLPSGLDFQLECWKKDWGPLNTQHETIIWRQKPFPPDVTVGLQLSKFDALMSFSSISH